jgi:2-dehydro-3-deoxyphosphooctonate aldolase (KDO 8-P synthase)
MSSYPESPYTRPIQVGSATIGGGHPFVLLGGPALVDGRGDPFAVAERLDTLTRELDVPFIFKSAAPGDLDPTEFEKSVSLLREIRSRFAIPVCVELRDTGQVDRGAEAANLLHIPSDLCRQTDLLGAAARTGRPVSIEKGPFLAPWDAVHILEKVSSVGNWNVMLIECGSSFGYDRRVVDFPGFEVMREAGFPFLFDASRSLEKPILDTRSCSGWSGVWPKPPSPWEWMAFRSWSTWRVGGSAGRGELADRRPFAPTPATQGNRTRGEDYLNAIDFGLTIPVRLIRHPEGLQEIAFGTSRMRMVGPIIFPGSGTNSFTRRQVSNRRL